MNFKRLLPWLLIAGAALWVAEAGTPIQRRLGRQALPCAPQPLTIDEAIQIALRQNPQVLNAEQEIERQKGQVIEVRSQALPHVTLNASFQREAESLARGGANLAGFGSPPGNFPGASRSPTPTPTPTPTPSPTASPTATPRASPSVSPSPSPSGAGGAVQNTSWQITIQATQVIYSGGRIKAAIRIAKLTEDQQIFLLRDTIDQVVATVRQQFYLGVLNGALICVQEEAVELLTAQVADQRARYDAGTVPRFNVIQAEVALANALPALIQARNNYRISLLQLAKTLGYETRNLPANQEPFRLIGGLVTPPICLGLAEALQQARERRPSLKAQRQNILIEVEDIVLQQAGYKPSVQANAGYVIQNDRFAKSLGDVVHGWFFGVQGNWNIFDGFETYGKVKQARARLEEAHINYDDAVAQVDLEVQQSWANLNQALETLISQLKNVEQAEEAVRLARERLAAGVGTQLDLLNATVALTQAQVTRLQAQYNYISSLAEFDRATGSATKYSETFQDPLVKRRRPVWRERTKTVR